jgi:hypothetical protein
VLTVTSASASHGGVPVGPSCPFSAARRRWPYARCYRAGMIVKRTYFNMPGCRGPRAADGVPRDGALRVGT